MASNPHYVGDAKSATVPDNENPENKKIWPRGFSIVWGNDSRYWKIPSSGDGPAELLQVSWLEVTVSVDIKSNKSYEAGFKVSLTPDAFGWSGRPLFIMTKRRQDPRPIWRKVTVDNKKDSSFEIKAPSPKRGDTDETESLYFGLYEVWGGKWKGGLRIHHAFVREV